MKEINLIDALVGDTVIIDIDINQNIRQGMRLIVLETDSDYVDYSEDDREEPDLINYYRITEKNEKGIASWIDETDYDRVTCFTEVKK